VIAYQGIKDEIAQLCDTDRIICNARLALNNKPLQPRHGLGDFSDACLPCGDKLEQLRNTRGIIIDPRCAVRDEGFQLCNFLFARLRR